MFIKYRPVFNNKQIFYVFHICYSMAKNGCVSKATVCKFLLQYDVASESIKLNAGDF